MVLVPWEGWRLSEMNFPSALKLKEAISMTATVSSVARFL